MTAAFHDEVTQGAPEPSFVLVADHLDESRLVDVPMRKQRGPSLVPLVTCGIPPGRVGQQRGLRITSIGGDHAVPAARSVPPTVRVAG